MTVKELSEFTGKNKSTVGRWVAKCNTKQIADKLQNATQYSPADFTIDEVSIILENSTLSKDAVRILMENARKPASSLEVQTAPNQMDILFAFMERQQQANQQFMTAVLSELRGFRSQPLQLEQPRQDYYSLVAYCSLNKIKTSTSELKKMGMDLRKMSLAAGRSLHKIPDERYGQVNSYPIEILDEYFSE